MSIRFQTYIEKKCRKLLGTLTITWTSVPPLLGSALTDVSSASTRFPRSVMSDSTLAASRLTGVPRETAARMRVTNDRRKSMMLRVKVDVGENCWFDEKQSPWRLLNPDDGLHGKVILFCEGSDVAHNTPDDLAARCEETMGNYEKRTFPLHVRRWHGLSGPA